MSSSNESEDEEAVSKPNMSKKEASNSYLTLLNSNNKFSEMLKNKIKLTDSSPTLTKHSFKPIASSTQIGTPVEFKRKKHAKKHADVVNNEGKDYRDVIVKNKQSSEDSERERKVLKKPKPQIVKKKVSHAEHEAIPSKTGDKDIINTKNRKCGSESSKSDSDTQRSAERFKIRTQSSSEQSSSEDETGKKRKFSEMSKEPFSKQSNFKINFARYNTDELAISKHALKNKQTSTKSKTQMDNLPSPPHINREVSSDTASKKEKRKLARMTSVSQLSDNDRTQISVIPPNGNAEAQNSSDATELPSEKRQKTKKKRKERKASISDSEVEASKSRLQPPQSLVTKGKRESSTSNDDGVDESQHYKKDSDNNRWNTTPSSRLRKLELDDSLTIIPNQFDSFNNIKPKETVYIVQIPIKLDPNRLINTSISLNGNVRVNKKYDSVATYEPQQPITICNNTESVNVKIIQPVGSIKLQRRLESAKIPDVPDVLNKSVAFPANLKSRHPLFGSDFDNKITLEEHVKMKLESVRDSPVKKKKKKEKRHRAEETEHQEEEIFKFLSQVNEESERVEEKKKKKKKKRENSECEEGHKAGGSNEGRNEEVGEEVPKKKKKKRDSDDLLIQDMLLSQIAMLDRKKKKKKKKEG